MENLCSYRLLPPLLSPGSAGVILYKALLSLRRTLRDPRVTASRQPAASPYSVASRTPD